MRLIDKTILVTGAASGFGKGMAERFNREGADTLLFDQNLKGVQQVASALNDESNSVKSVAYHCDVSDQAMVNDAVQDCIAEHGKVDIVVNNAGWSHKNQPILDVDSETFRRVYEINVFSIYYMTQAIVPHWRATGGGVMINISSTAGIRPRPGLTWYNSTKGAVNVMTKSLATELAPENIRVCGIAPVIGNTGLTETFMGVPNTPQNREKFMATIPIGRFSRPEDIASAAVYLASDEASFITGVILEVDGGRCV